MFPIFLFFLFFFFLFFSFCYGEQFFVVLLLALRWLPVWILTLLLQICFWYFILITGSPSKLLIREVDSMPQCCCSGVSKRHKGSGY